MKRELDQNDAELAIVERSQRIMAMSNSILEDDLAVIEKSHATALQSSVLLHTAISIAIEHRFGGLIKLSAFEIMRISTEVLQSLEVQVARSLVSDAVENAIAASGESLSSMELRERALQEFQVIAAKIKSRIDRE